MLQWIDIDAALVRAGFVPPRVGSRKTTCPHCSDFRVKRDERCVGLRINDDQGLVLWKCFHCKREGDVYVDAR